MDRSIQQTTLVYITQHAQAYAAFPCLKCFVTDAGCYYEYKQDRKTEVAFLTGDQYTALLAACPKPQEATKACWEAAGLKVGWVNNAAAWCLYIMYKGIYPWVQATGPIENVEQQTDGKTH